MARHPPDKELIALVLEAAERGTPASEIAVLAGKDESTIRKWVRRYGKPGQVTGASVATPELRAQYSGVGDPVDIPPPPSDDPVPPLPPDATSLQRARHAYDVSSRAADQAMRLGNMTAAQRNMRDAANLLPTIARLEKAENGDQDSVRISKADVARIRAQLSERVKSVLRRPILCAHCGHLLSVQLAESEDE